MTYDKYRQSAIHGIIRDINAWSDATATPPEPD